MQKVAEHFALPVLKFKGGMQDKIEGCWLNVITCTNITSWLLVSDKPIFSDLPMEQQTGIEGQPLVLSLLATGNPSNIVYTWTKDGIDAGRDSRVLVDGPVLNITKLRKEDSGIYMCEAVNSEGSTSFKFNLTVQCTCTSFKR
jgi:hypothetical protein